MNSNELISHLINAVIWGIGPFCGALAAYIAIRVDIVALKTSLKAQHDDINAALRDDISNAKACAMSAHARIDRLSNGK